MSEMFNSNYNIICLDFAVESNFYGTAIKRLISEIWCLCKLFYGISDISLLSAIVCVIKGTSHNLHIKPGEIYT